MNASSWKKAADLVAKVTPANPQVQAAAMAESQQLQSIPLSALSVDDSRPPQVTYDSQQPIATSTPRATSTERPEIPIEAYRQILPGMSDCLYPTLVADGSLNTHVPDNHSMLQTQLTSKVDKYLQEAAERCERDVNYFDGWHVATNTTSQQQKVDFVEHNEEEILELIDHDTGTTGEIDAEHYIRHHEELETIPEENDEDLSMIEQDDIDEVDMILYTPEESDDEPFNMAIDDTSKDPTIVMGKLVTTAFVSEDVRIPTEKVGCLQVTSQLKEFLNHFPPESREKAFEQIYEILQMLDAYLIDNPQQHIYCMSPDSEYVSLIMYATRIEIDLCNFLAIWAVLSILLDIQSNKLQHVKNLQQVVDHYYDKCPMEVMSRLEHQTNDIMYDSVNNDNFDSISDYTDRVSGVVDNGYDRDDKDNDDMPYDKDNDDMPDDNDNDQMPNKYANDYETAITEVKYDRNMTNDELKDVGTKDVVLYKIDDRMMTKVKWPIETSDINDEFMREYGTLPLTEKDPPEKPEDKDPPPSSSVEGLDTEAHDKDEFITPSSPGSSDKTEETPTSPIRTRISTEYSPRDTSLRDPFSSFWSGKLGDVSDQSGRRHRWLIRKPKRRHSVELELLDEKDPRPYKYVLEGDRPLFPRQRFYSSHLDARDITFQQANFTLRYIVQQRLQEKQQEETEKEKRERVKRGDK